MAKETFAKAMPHVFTEEGGYVDNPRDPGGATNLGITISTLSAWEGRKVSKAEVKALNKAKATSIYRANYWSKIDGDALPAGVDYAVFDFAINSGPARAVKFLQRIVGVAQDGVVGAKTLAAVHKMSADRIINALSDNRIAWLKTLGTFKDFGKGWLARVGRVRTRALAFTRNSDVATSATIPAPAKAVQSDTSLTDILKKPEAWGPIGGVATGVVSAASGPGPLQWAFAVAMIALVAVGIWYFVRRVRSEA